ncbi:MAG: ABC transporter permease [Acidobacteria bacterium]|nr:ABC transporter permease [Acidobacteriota bacterium]
MLKDIWANRTLIWAFTKRDLRGRYAGSTVGFLWSVIHPLAMILVYTIVFSEIMKTKLPATAELGQMGYVVYLCAAILPWISMQETLIRSCTVFIEYSALIKKVSFPPVILVAYIVTAGFINMLISFGVFFIIMFLTGVGFGIHILLLPVSLLIYYLFTFAMGLILSSVNVFFRDMQQIVSIFLTVWFWVTPIVYLPKALPENLRFVTEMNPMNYLMNLFRDPIFENQFYHWREAILFTISSLLLLIIGRAIHKKLRKHIPDEI